MDDNDIITNPDAFQGLSNWMHNILFVRKLEFATGGPFFTINAQIVQFNLCEITDHVLALHRAACNVSDLNQFQCSVD